MENIQVTGAYIYYEIPILGGIKITSTTVSLLIVTAFLMIVGVMLGRNLKKRPGKLQVLTEKGVMMLHNLVSETMGSHNAHWMPYIGTIFLSSLFGSLVGLTGFFRSTTADLSVPLVWALMTTAIIWYQSIKQSGLAGWLKGFTEPIVVMTPMNIISEIAQPISMAFRHFGNVAGGGVITSILYTALSLASTVLIGAVSSTIVTPIIFAALGVFLFISAVRKKKLFRKVLSVIVFLIGVLGALQYFDICKDIPLLQFGIPAVLSVYFDIFSGFIQAFVFSLLSMVYISNACPAPVEQSKS